MRPGTRWAISGRTVAGAATFGWIAGKSAAERAKGIKGFQQAEKSPVVREAAETCSQILERESGPDWKEANLALQQIMNDYAGVEVRSETLLSAGSQVSAGSEEESQGHAGGGQFATP